MVDETNEANESTAELLKQEIEVLEAELAVHGESGLPEWFLGKLKMLDALEDEIKRRAAEWRVALERTRAALCMKYGRDFKADVTQELQKNPKRKLLRFLTGQAGFRKSSDKIVVEDEAAAIAWCDVHCPGAVKVTKSVRLTELLVHVKDTGEEPNGCRFEAATDKFVPKIVDETLARLEAMDYKPVQDDRKQFDGPVEHEAVF